MAGGKTLTEVALQNLRGFAGAIRTQVLEALYDNGYNIEHAVAEAYQQGIDVTRVVEKMWVDDAIDFAFKYQDGWFLECYPTEGCIVPLRRMYTSRASHQFDHYVWNGTGTM